MLLSHRKTSPLRPSALANLQPRGSVCFEYRRSDCGIRMWPILSMPSPPSSSRVDASSEMSHRLMGLSQKIGGDRPPFKPTKSPPHSKKKTRPSSRGFCFRAFSLIHNRSMAQLVRVRSNGHAPCSDPCNLQPDLSLLSRVESDILQMTLHVMVSSG